MIRGYDDWKLSSGCDEEVIVTHCECCDGEIYKGYEMVISDDGVFCDKECLIDHMLQMVDYREEVAS